MTGLVRKATFFTVGALLVAASAMAGVPSPGYSNVTTPGQTNDDVAIGVGDGGGMYAIGTNGGGPAIPDPIGRIHVNVRDLANNPINNCSVSISLGGCVDLRLGDQLLAVGGADAGATVFCPGNGPSVRKYTDVNGDVDFILEGAGAGSGPPAPGCGFAPSPLRGKVIAAGVTLRNVIIAFPDLDGANGIDSNDLSLWLDDIGSGNPYMRSDYDFGGTVDSNDLSLWLDMQGGATAATFASATNLCN